MSDSDKELIDLDEKGNPVEINEVKEEKNEEKNEDKNEEKKNSSKSLKYIFIFIVIIILVLLLFIFLYKKNTNTKTIFDTTYLRNKKIKNRVFFGDIFDASFEEGKMPEKIIKRIEELSKNDVGLIVTCETLVGDYGPLLEKECPRLDDDKYIEEFKKLSDIAHKYNSVILLQLNHHGLHSYADIVYSPNGDKAINQDINSKEMTKEDILRIQNYFVETAKRAKKAGYDGIQLTGAGFYLLGEFLSNQYNRRNDEYGGSEEKRAKFLEEIIKKIRVEIGNDFIISAKLNCDDDDKIITESGLITTGKIIEKAGADNIEVIGLNELTSKNRPPILYKQCKELSENINISVTCTSGIKNYEDADYAIKNSKIEYVSIARELVKQPDLVRQWYQKYNNN